MSELMAIFNFFQDYKSEIRRNEKYKISEIKQLQNIEHMIDMNQKQLKEGS
jgi:hypothetical protein